MLTLMLQFYGFKNDKNVFVKRGKLESVNKEFLTLH